jgi:hypothetical protein
MCVAASASLTRKYYKLHLKLETWINFDKRQVDGFNDHGRPLGRIGVPAGAPACCIGPEQIKNTLHGLVFSLEVSSELRGRKLTLLRRQCQLPTDFSFRHIGLLQSWSWRSATYVLVVPRRIIHCQKKKNRCRLVSHFPNGPVTTRVRPSEPSTLVSELSWRARSTRRGTSTPENNLSLRHLPVGSRSQSRKQQVHGHTHEPLLVTLLLTPILSSSARSLALIASPPARLVSRCLQIERLQRSLPAEGRNLPAAASGRAVLDKLTNPPTPVPSSSAGDPLHRSVTGWPGAATASVVPVCLSGRVAATPSGGLGWERQGAVWGRSSERKSDAPGPGAGLPAGCSAPFVNDSGFGLRWCGRQRPRSATAITAHVDQLGACEYATTGLGRWDAGSELAAWPLVDQMEMVPRETREVVRRDARVVDDDDRRQGPSARIMWATRWHTKKRYWFSRSNKMVERRRGTFIALRAVMPYTATVESGCVRGVDRRGVCDCSGHGCENYSSVHVCSVLSAHWKRVGSISVLLIDEFLTRTTSPFLPGDQDIVTI